MCVCVCVLSSSDVTFIPHASHARVTEHIRAVPQVFSNHLAQIQTEIDPKRVLTSAATPTFDPPAADRMCRCGFTWFKNDCWNVATAFTPHKRLIMEVARKHPCL